MSDFLGNQHRQKMDAELQITSPHKNFKNWKDVDETKLALAIEIPYFLLTNGMGKSLAKPILQPLSLTNFTHNVWWAAQIIFNNTETKPTQQHLHTWKCTWTPPRCSNIIQTSRSHIKDNQKKDPSFGINKPVKIKISGDGAKMSRMIVFLPPTNRRESHVVKRKQNNYYCQWPRKIQHPWTLFLISHQWHQLRNCAPWSTVELWMTLCLRFCWYFISRREGCCEER